MAKTLPPNRNTDTSWMGRVLKMLEQIVQDNCICHDMEHGKCEVCEAEQLLEIYDKKMRGVTYDGLSWMVRRS